MAMAMARARGGHGHGQAMRPGGEREREEEGGGREEEEEEGEGGGGGGGGREGGGRERRKKKEGGGREGKKKKKKKRPPGRLTGNPILTVNVGNTGLVRTATVSYTANSSNAFPSLLGAPVWPIRGAATASASGAPNINFYLLLDNSPSMAIAATSTDITKMVAATASQPSGSRSCAFACHEKNPQSNSGANSSTKDNLSIARSNNITLRIDLVAQATASLMSTAQQTEATQNNTYKAAIYTFDYGFNTIYAPSGLPLPTCRVPRPRPPTIFRFSPSIIRTAYFRAAASPPTTALTS